MFGRLFGRFFIVFGRFFNKNIWSPWPLVAFSALCFAGQGKAGQGRARQGRQKKCSFTLNQCLRDGRLVPHLCLLFGWVACWCCYLVPTLCYFIPASLPLELCNFFVYIRSKNYLSVIVRLKEVFLLVDEMAVDKLSLDQMTKRRTF